MLPAHRYRLQKAGHQPAPQKVEIQTAAAPSVRAQLQWAPAVMGHPYQLSLQNKVFGFCDDTGSQQMDVTTGKQTPGTAHCDRVNGDDQSRCGDEIQILGHPDGGKDVLSFEGSDYPLEGQSHGCDRDGKLVIVPTVGAVELIDGASNKVAIVDPGGGNKAMIGSGWVAWSTLDLKHPLRVES